VEIDRGIDYLSFSTWISFFLFLSSLLVLGHISSLFFCFCIGIYFYTPKGLGDTNFLAITPLP